ncbi:hypothetical protein [Actinacidiphila acididurans]|uniref:Uncharacterized protein n=1 Tax=Actinacidiphila acididurans TaxID=2784346 RepID=A0ABS2TTW4_9ACTN|nr:hypothetical protein [Actinacidiphila acididurans]MBM9506257.1 hypothetical protein [Actinacidiphila acididurans]
MGGVRAWRFGIGLAGCLLLVAGVVNCGFMARAVWSAGAARDAHHKSDSGTSAADQPDESDLPAVPADISGSTLVTVRKANAHHWRVTTRYRFTLGARAPLLGWLRDNPEGFADLLPHLPGGYATEHADTSGKTDLPRTSGISQPSRTANAVVTASSSRLLGAGEIPSLAYDLSWTDANGNEVSWARARWTFAFDAPGLSASVHGQPDAQQEHRATFQLGGPGVARENLYIQLYDPRTWADPGPLQGFLPVLLSALVVAVTAVVGRSLLSRAAEPLLPAATRPRWQAALLIGVLLLASVTVLTDVEIVDWTKGAIRADGAEFTDISPAAGAQQALMAVNWFALPVLVQAVLVRAVTGRPPRAEDIWPVTAPAICLLLMETAVAGFPGWAGVSWLFVIVSAAGSGVLLRRGPRGRPGHRWAATAAATSLAGTAGMTALIRFPDAAGADPGRTFWSLAAGATAVLLVLPWAMTFLAGSRRLAGAPRWSPAAVLLAVAAVGAALLPWRTESYGWIDPQRASLGISMLADLGGLAPPGATRVTSLQQLTAAWQIVWIGCAVLLLTVLRRAGQGAGRWAPGARLWCTALVWLAATSSLSGNPITVFGRWTSPVLTVLAALCVPWLVPLPRAAQARRLHRLSRAAHVRLVNSLLAGQLLGAGRGGFLRDSSAQLADGSLTPADWNARWQSLSGTAPDPAGALTRLRGAALGSSGGYAPWANGATAAVVTLLLGLPWSVSLWWQAWTPDGLPQALTTTLSAVTVWAAFGFTYGYLYSWLRGRDPLTKAGYLTAAMLPVQLLLMPSQFDGIPAATQVLSLCGQTALIGLGLGLYWEARLVRAAGMPWGYVRNARRASSLVVPATTVLLAAATTLATVFADNWANSLTDQPSRPPASVSTPTPGAP